MPKGLVPYELRLLGWRDQIGLLLSLELVRPSKRDRALINLPKWLDGLYYLIRPIRILVDRSQR